MPKREPHPSYPALSEGLRKAFADLRQQGYVALRHHTCCSSCGWDAIPDDKANRAVFLHDQAENRVRQNGTATMQWAGDGAVISNALQAAGLQVEWNGAEDQCITAKVPTAH